MQVSSKSIHFFRRYRVGKPNLISFHGLVTLKMRPRSPKSNQLFPISQPRIYASLVKIHPLVQKISRRKEATRTRTRTPTPTGSAPKTICPPLSVGGHKYNALKLYNAIKCFLKSAKALACLPEASSSFSFSGCMSVAITFAPSLAHACRNEIISNNYIIANFLSQGGTIR